jgi:ligand-binding SRPBCC domain-containing protein
MMKLYFEAEVKSSVKEVKNQFNQELFLKLKPPFMSLELERFDGCEKGHEVHLKMGLPGFLQNWVSHITDSSQTDTAWEFVDEGKILPPPFTYWRHTHRVEKMSETSSRISDSIEYRCQSRLLEKLLWGPLWLSFSIRPRVYREVFGG